MLGILSLALGWLLIYSGWAGVGVFAEVKHVFAPGTYAAPHPTNPQTRK